MTFISFLIRSSKNASEAKDAKATKEQQDTRDAKRHRSASVGDEQASAKRRNADWTDADPKVDENGTKSTRMLQRKPAEKLQQIPMQVRQISNGYVEILRIERCGDKPSTGTSRQSWMWACQVFGFPTAQISSEQRAHQYRLLSRAVHPDKNVETTERANAVFQRVNAANVVLKSAPPLGLPILQSFPSSPASSTSTTSPTSSTSSASSTSPTSSTSSTPAAAVPGHSRNSRARSVSPSPSYPQRPYRTAPIPSQPSDSPAAPPQFGRRHNCSDHEAAGKAPLRPCTPPPRPRTVAFASQFSDSTVERMATAMRSASPRTPVASGVRSAPVRSASPCTPVASAARSGPVSGWPVRSSVRSASPCTPVASAMHSGPVSGWPVRSSVRSASPCTPVASAVRSASPAPKTPKAAPPAGPVTPKACPVPPLSFPVPSTSPSDMDGDLELSFNLGGLEKFIDKHARVIPTAREKDWTFATSARSTISEGCRRPTTGDVVEVLGTPLTREHRPELIGKRLVVSKDDPYALMCYELEGSFRVGQDDVRICGVSKVLREINGM